MNQKIKLHNNLSLGRKQLTTQGENKLITHSVKKLTTSGASLLTTLSGVFCMLFALTGCDMVVMDPSGDVAKQEAWLIWVSTGLMLIIIIPVIILTLWFAWHYRASNKDANYEPEWDHSSSLEMVIWSAPLAIIMVLSGITFVATHRLDPYAPLTRIGPNEPVPEDAEVLVIEAVALDWKWLFLYPEEGVASVNELAAPIDRPIRFKITSGSVMNSLYIPALAGQIYAMAGMETKLHAVINEVGVYKGFSANYSGHGFSGMHFQFHGMYDGDFDNWISKLREQGNQLNADTFLKLKQPTMEHPVTYYGQVDGELFHDILNFCVEPNTTCVDQFMQHDAGTTHSGSHSKHIGGK